MTKEKTIAQFLNVKTFPFKINDEKGNNIYYENDDGYWSRCEYDSNGNLIYSIDKDGYWSRYKYDSNKKQIYSIDNEGYWCKHEYDSDGYLIYSEDNDGIEFDNRPKLEITLKEIAEWKGVNVSQIYIKE
jgi:hypothetical protein